MGNTSSSDKDKNKNTPRDTSRDHVGKLCPQCEVGVLLYDGCDRCYYRVRH